MSSFNESCTLVEVEGTRLCGLLRLGGQVGGKTEERGEGGVDHGGEALIAYGLR